MNKKNVGKSTSFAATSRPRLRREINLVCDNKSDSFTATNRSPLRREIRLICGGNQDCHIVNMTPCHIGNMTIAIVAGLASLLSQKLRDIHVLDSACSAPKLAAEPAVSCAASTTHRAASSQYAVSEASGELQAYSW